MGKSLENCNTATPQQREQNDARIGSAERQRGSTSVNAPAPARVDVSQRSSKASAKQKKLGKNS